MLNLMDFMYLAIVQLATASTCKITLDFEYIKDGIRKVIADAVFLVQNWMQSFKGLVLLSQLNKVQSFMKTKFFSKPFFMQIRLM